MAPVIGQGTKGGKLIAKFSGPLKAAFGKVKKALRFGDEAVNLASSGRTRHILYGDAFGGGHKFGFGRLFNGKTKFPLRWNKDKIMHAVSDVATNPNSKWIQQTGKKGSLFTKKGHPVKWEVNGLFEGLRIRVIIQDNKIITAFPKP